ncbi:hypothetical protein PSSHI_14480 [Photobacterium sp. R1]
MIPLRQTHPSLPAAENIQDLPALYEIILKKVSYLVRVTRLPADLRSALQSTAHPLYQTALLYARLMQSNLLWKVWAIDEEDQIWLEVNDLDQDGEPAFHTLKLDEGTYQKIDYEEYRIEDLSLEKPEHTETSPWTTSLEVQSAIAWLPAYFKDRQTQIAKILNAGGCRELWMQGDIYLYLNDDALRTNATKYRFDLYKEDQFAIELKVLGGQYQSKVVSFLENDFRKLLSNTTVQDKYVVLVLDNSSPETKLYSRLFSYAHPSGSLISQLDFGAFCVRIWKVAGHTPG